MRRSVPAALAALMLGLLPALAMAADAPGKSLTLLFTGDNGGEVAPCG